MRILFVLQLLFYTSCYGQWSNLGQGLDEQARRLYYDPTVNSLIVIGNFNQADSLTANHIASWNGSFWNTYGSGSPEGAPGYSITKFQNQYYFSSVFYYLNPNDNWLARWSGTTWDTISPRLNGPVYYFTEYNNELYLGGGFTKIGTLDAPMIAKFDGVNFTTFPLPISWGGIFAIANYHGQMYVGGNFYDTLTLTNDLEIFNGNSFSPFPSGGLAFGSDNVTSFSIFNNELYIGGSFSTQTGSVGNNIMKWDGAIMSPVLNGVNGQITSMHVYNNQLYVCGEFTMADTISASGIASWDGTRWHSVIPYSNNLLGINDFLFIGNDLYITGSFEYIDFLHVKNIAKYSFGNSNVDEHDNLHYEVNPNPTATILQISGNIKMNRVAIRNILGNELFSEINTSTNRQINVSYLQKGIYFLEIETNYGSVVKKFVKE